MLVCRSLVRGGYKRWWWCVCVSFFITLEVSRVVAGWNISLHLSIYLFYLSIYIYISIYLCLYIYISLSFLFISLYIYLYTLSLSFYISLYIYISISHANYLVLFHSIHIYEQSNMNMKQGCHLPSFLSTFSFFSTPLQLTNGFIMTF